MTDPLLRIEAVIETLGSQGAGFWTLMDTSQTQVSNAEAQENRCFGHFGRFGHRTENTIGDELLEEHENAPDGDAKTSRASRASSPIYEGVQSVQDDQKPPLLQGVVFGHLEAASVQNPGPGVQKPPSERVDDGWHAIQAPVDWAEGVALLREAPAPRGYPQHAWQQLIVDVERFLNGWAAQAAALGWPIWELFGCHRRAPWGRIQGLGLILLLRGDEIAALTATEAVIRTSTGAYQTYRRKPADPLHPAERCLVWEFQDEC